MQGRYNDKRVRNNRLRCRLLQRHNTKCNAKKGNTSHARKRRQAGTHGTVHLAVQTGQVRSLSVGPPSEYGPSDGQAEKGCRAQKFGCQTTKYSAQNTYTIYTPSICRKIYGQILIKKQRGASYTRGIKSSSSSSSKAFSALTRLGGRKGIWPVKLSGGMLEWLFVWREVQICIWPSICHCHSLSLAPVNPD